MMRFAATADTDIGISKNTNQDSVLIKHASYDGGEVLLAVICDGMGGLARGELASATVIRAFAKWFDEELPYELENVDLKVIGGKWSLMLKDLNVHILEASKKYCRSGEAMGTTFTGILFVGDQYVIAHVGDTRVYQITSDMKQLTTDQTFVAREVSRGTMTLEQALQDKRRNMLLQCVGASDVVEPAEMLKQMKDLNTLFIMEDLSNAKLVDFNAAVLRQNKKPIELGDAYRVLSDGSVSKIRIVKSSEGSEE